MKRRDFVKSTFAIAAASTLEAAEQPIAKLSPHANDAHWSTLKPLPINTQELYPAVHKRKLYLAGGIASKLGAPYFTDRFFSYNPEENDWREKTSLPESLHHAALVECDNRLFLVGGFNGGYSHVWRMRERVYEYVNNRWEERTSLPAPQAEGVLTSHQGVIHLVSGQSPQDQANSKRSDHKEVSVHLLWQPGDSKWQSAAPIPLARNSATGGWVGDQLIISGGRNSAGNFSETHIYDHKEDKWREASPLPLPQAGTASATVDDGLIVFGGEIFVPESGVFKNVWHYSLSRDHWQAYPDMPTPRHGIGAGKIDNKIYVVGGATKPGGAGTSNLNEVLSLV